MSALSQVVGLIPSQVRPKDGTMVLTASLLGAQYSGLELGTQ